MSIVGGTGLGNLSGTSYGSSMTSVAGGTIATQAANASGASKYITAVTPTGEGGIHPGCLPGAPYAVAWVIAHKECAGVTGMVIPITPYYAGLMEAIEITNANFERNGNAATATTQLHLNGFVQMA